MRRFQLFFIVFVLLAVSALPAISQGCTPIPFTRVITYPIQISVPGCYEVTRDLSTAGSGHVGGVIEILSNNVSIDLNGFTIETVGGILAAGAIYSTGFSNIEIRNGTVSGGVSTIDITSGNNVLIENVRILTAPFTAGITLDSVSNFRIRDNLIWGASDNGIVIQGTSSTPFSGTIAGNQILDTKAGIVVGIGASIAVINNRIRTSPGGPLYGLAVGDTSGCIIADNTVVDAGLEGIYLVQSTNCELRDNVVRDAGTVGISLDSNSHDNLLLGNQVTGSGGSGILIDSERNLVQRNQSNSNGEYGLEFGINAAMNVFRENLARGNPGPQASCNPDATDDFCERNMSANTSHGDNYIPILR